MTITDRADKFFSLLVRAPGVCANCGKTDMIQCAHGFSRRYRNTRWDLRNAWPLCKGCHFHFTVRPLEWDEWMRDRLGTTYDELRMLALSTAKVDTKQIAVELEQAWKETR